MNYAIHTTEERGEGRIFFSDSWPPLSWILVGGEDDGCPHGFGNSSKDVDPLGVSVTDTKHETVFEPGVEIVNAYRGLKVRVSRYLDPTGYDPFRQDKEGQQRYAT